MLFTWKDTESLENPLLVDDKSSSYGLYVRKDVVKEDDKYKYKELYLDNSYKMDIENVEEYQQKLLERIEKEETEHNNDLHITKLDFYTNLCVPAGITYDVLSAKITELGMQAQWDLCNHVYYGVIKPFLAQLPLGKTEEEIIAIYEELTK